MQHQIKLTRSKTDLMLPQIFESNSKPHKYATNCHFAGTNKKPLNNIIEITGSSMTTATRTFRAVFREHTGVSWDDRIKAHNERVLARQDREAESPGILSTRRGENGDIKSTTRADEDAIPFDERKFEYMPPLHSAKGWLPDGRDEVPEIVQRMRKVPNGRRNRTEQWKMSGGSGDGPEDGGLAPRGSVEQIDLTDDGPEDQQPESVGGDDTFVGDAVDAGTDAEDPSAQAFGADNFLEGLNEWSTQDNTFDMGGLAGQQQPEFNFGQNHTDVSADQGIAEPNDFSADIIFGTNLNNSGDIFGQEQEDPRPATEGVSGAESATGAIEEVQAAAVRQPEVSETGGLGGLPFPYETQANQTQLAAMVGEDLLNLVGQGDASVFAEPDGMGGLENDSAYQISTGGVGAGKRKRDEDDESGEDSAAKRVEAGFEGETFAT